jgi:hypothetical protein|tara:strand:+ start:803 stop:1060 length:258 start_codon:yes stop_codon:yes gene_type:complete
MKSDYRKTYEKAQMEWEHKYYSQLKGYTIDSFEFEVDDVDEGYDSRFPTFTLTKKGWETLKVQVSQDEEGNGSGFLFISNKKVKS